jgi:hypothetical protein
MMDYTKIKIQNQLLPAGAEVIEYGPSEFRVHSSKKYKEMKRVNVIYKYKGEIRRSNFSASSCGLQFDHRFNYAGK